MDNKSLPAIVLIGSTGFVGTHILRKLIEDKQHKHRVILLVRTIPINPFPDVEYLVGSLPNQIPRNLLPNEPHILIHFGTLQISKEKELYHQVNVMGTKALLAICNSYTLGIIYGSSMSVYGQGEQIDYLESEPLMPDTELAKSRSESEALILSYATRNKICAYCLRPRFIVGEGDKYILPSFEKMIENRIRIGSGRQKFSLIEVNDYAFLVIKLSSTIQERTNRKTPQQLALNMGYRDPISLNDILETLSKSLGRTQPLLRFSIPTSLYLLAMAFLPIKNRDALKTKAELIGRSHWGNTSQLEKVVAAEPIANDPKQLVDTLAKAHIFARKKFSPINSKYFLVIVRGRNGEIA